MGLDICHLTPIQKVGDNHALEFLSLENLADSPGYITRNEKFIVDSKSEKDGIEKGMFFDLKGQQRKGMRREFFSDFENDRIYFELQIAAVLYGYLSADHVNTLVELQLNFQLNFIDNFVEGESVFVVSW